MIYLVIALLTIFIVFQVIWFIEMGNLKQELNRLVTHTFFADTPEYTDEFADTPADAPEHERVPLTDEEIAILEREAEFDLRIAKMKEELAYQMPDKPVNPTVAEVYHPLVQNLPHNSIQDLYDTLPDVEYSR